MPDAKAIDALNTRLYVAARCASLSELAAFLETTPSQITAAHELPRCPVAWIQTNLIRHGRLRDRRYQGAGEKSISYRRDRTGIASTIAIVYAV